MTDQAAALRAMVGLRPPGIALRRDGSQALVIGSGKGGVGKSVLAALAAGCLARQGRRVLLLDGAQNLGNLHVLLGVRPRFRLEDLLESGGPVADLVHPVADGVWLVPGDSGARALYALGPADRARLHHRLSALYDDFDVVLVDAGAGLEAAVRVATMRASRLLVITAPEPTALTDAYALIKIVTTQIPDLPVDLLVNRVTDGNEGYEAHARLAKATARFLHRDLRRVGDVPEDPALRRAARHTTGLLDSQPHPAWRAMEEIVDRIPLPAPAARSSANAEAALVPDPR